MVNPSRVTDVIFQVGLNDTRDGFSTQRTRDNIMETQIRYHRAFPNARQHLMELPPICDPQIEMNALIRKLAIHTGSNLVSTKQFRDRTTGHLRLNTMANDGFHYNEVGVKILAKEIKKSLFSMANRENASLTVLNNFRSYSMIDNF